MSLQIPHRDKAAGSHAATKAVILVSVAEEDIRRAADVDVDWDNRLVDRQEEHDSDLCR